MPVVSEPWFSTVPQLQQRPSGDYLSDRAAADLGTLGGVVFVALKRSLSDETAARIACADDFSEVVAA